MKFPTCHERHAEGKKICHVLVVAFYFARGSLVAIFAAESLRVCRTP